MYLAWWPTFLHDASRSGRWDATTDDATNVGDGQVITAPPRKLELAQNHPNPFNPTTTIAFGIPGSEVQPVNLRIFDVVQPSAMLSIWWPRHIPNTGSPASKTPWIIGTA